MFLKFMLSKKVRPYCGVKISNVRMEERWENDRLGGWDIWERNMTGPQDYPHHACKAVKWTKEMTMGEKKYLELFSSGRELCAIFHKPPPTTDVDHGCTRKGATKVSMAISLCMWTTYSQ